MLKIVVVGAQENARGRLFKSGECGGHGLTDLLQAGLQLGPFPTTFSIILSKRPVGKYN